MRLGMKEFNDMHHPMRRLYQRRLELLLMWRSGLGNVLRKRDMLTQTKEKVSEVAT